MNRLALSARLPSFRSQAFPIDRRQVLTHSAAVLLVIPILLESSATVRTNANNFHLLRLVASSVNAFEATAVAASSSDTATTPTTVSTSAAESPDVMIEPGLSDRAILEYLSKIAGDRAPASLLSDAASTVALWTNRDKGALRQAINRFSPDHDDWNE